VCKLADVFPNADDLQYFLVLARTRRLVIAAKQLGVDHTTVGRRVTALEKSLGQRLFDRTPDGWELTPSGHKLLAPAEAVDAALADMREVLSNSDAGLSGTVRLLCPDGFGSFLLAPRLGVIRERHPELVIELVTQTGHLEQTVRDFDVAVTLEEPSSPRVLHRKLTDHVLHLYASRTYLESHPPISRLEDIDSNDFIYYVDRLLDLAPLRVLSDLGFGAPYLQSTNMTVHWKAAKAGIGIALLPHYVAGCDDDLFPVISRVFRQSYWLALPREHARLARVRAVVSFIDQAVSENVRVIQEPDHRRWRPPPQPVHA
jgi:DNA-binding transcriptional LysR family regulator